MITNIRVTMGGLTGTELAHRLGVHPSLLYLWERMLGLSSRFGSLMKRRYDDGMVHLFENIKVLRQEGYDFATIAERLPSPLLRAGRPGQETSDNPRRKQESHMNQDNQSLIIDGVPPCSGGAPQTRLHQAPLRTVPIELVEHLNELQEQYTKAVYFIGQLEERLKTKEQRIAELERAREGPDREFREMLLLQELKDAQKYIGLLEGELAQLKNPPPKEHFGFIRRLFRSRSLPQTA